MANVVSDLPPGTKPERFQLLAGVKRVDLAGVADVILGRFLLYRDIFAVSMDAEAFCDLNGEPAAS